MKGLAKIFVTVVGLALVGLVVLSTLFIRVHPWSYGVKENLVAGGVSESDARTGFRVSHPRRAQVAHDRPADALRDLLDGQPPERHRNDARGAGDPDQGRQPRQLRPDHHLQGDRRQGERDRPSGQRREVPRPGGRRHRGHDAREAAKLSSEEIFSTEQRLEVAAGAPPALRVVLAKNFLEPEQVLIRAVRFQKSYEAKLQAKQLTYQELQLAQSQRLVEDERGKTESKSAEIEAAEKELRGDRDKELQTVRSENEVAIAGVRSEANVYDQQTRAESDADYETSIANGNLAIAKAEALRNELRNKALDTVGGRIYLAQQAAENLEFESVTLNSNDPRVPSVIDIGEMVKLLVGEASGSR